MVFTTLLSEVSQANMAGLGKCASETIHQHCTSNELLQDKVKEPWAILVSRPLPTLKSWEWPGNKATLSCVPETNNCHCCKLCCVCVAVLEWNMFSPMMSCDMSRLTTYEALGSLPAPEETAQALVIKEAESEGGATHKRRGSISHFFRRKFSRRKDCKKGVQT